MSSSNNEYSNGNKNGVYPLSLYLSSISSSHQEIISNNAYNHHQQLIASPGQMASAVPDSLVNYMPFHSNQQGFGFPEEIQKPPVRKDRHSKIHTAHGLRDRRVRLSIGVARQFFDLQDMLGFDKASKTLDWLLKKSSKSIKAVSRDKKKLNKDFGSNRGDVEEEEEEEEEEEDDDNDDHDDGDKSFVYGSSPELFEEEVICEIKKVEKRKKKSELSKARGKAKESTRGIAYDHHQENVSEITQSEILDPFKRSTLFFNVGEDMTNSFYKEAIEEFNNQESILTKRKINPLTNMFQSYNEHNGTFMLNNQGSSSNYDTIMPQHLDYYQNPFVDQPFCAITDTNFPRGFP